MEDKWLKRLEFDKVKQQLHPFAVTYIGRKIIDNLRPTSSFEEIQNKLNELAETQDINRLKGRLPVVQLENIEPHCKRLQMQASLNGFEIAQIGQVLKNVTTMQKLFSKLDSVEEQYPNLYTLEQQLVALPEIKEAIFQCLSPQGEILVTASPVISRLKQQIAKKEQQIKNTLSTTLRNSSKYLSDSIITMRNDRYVLPVKQEYRQMFGGIVHDQSSSGQTLFVEPGNVVELNNERHNLQMAEREEILRILQELSEKLMPYVEEIKLNNQILGYLDFVQSKADYAQKIKAHVPKIIDDQKFKFRQARHPLLPLDKAVSNDLYLGDTFKTLVVTGPNTGGKTITLKTIGLLQMMGQAGLAIPVAEGSTLGVYDQIMADIGDEQSIEQNLSTFSSHLVTITDIIDTATAKSLVMFDELGAGTDPKEGAALAMAILDTLQAKGTSVVATTHYPELKWYADDRLDTINASMEFDHQSLEPTYHLLIGLPGRSNAFEIAKRIGLDEGTIQIAESFIDDKNQSLNKMITDFEEKRQQLENEYSDLERDLIANQKLHDDLQQAYDLFTKEKKQLMKTAQKEANEVILKAEKRAEKIINDLKEKQQHLEETAVKEHELIDAKSKLKNMKYVEEQEALRKNKVLQKAKANKE